MALSKIIAVIGPTASGKTALGIELAKRFNGEIISADSRLVYKGMDIGTAKPKHGTSNEILNATTSSIQDLFRPKPYLVEDIPHWGIDLVNPDEDFNVSQFKACAEDRIAEIVKRGKLPIVVGGTGLWVDALIDNLTIPEVPPNAAIRAELELRGLDDLFAEYKRLDPVGAEVIDRHNKRRLVRALEVCRVTSKPFSSMQIKGRPKFDALKIGLDVEREALTQRIDNRVDEMIGNGLVNEVRALLKKYPADAIAMSGIGYRQIAFFLNGKANLAAAIEDMKRDSRAYAKRQMTWFKRDERIKWIKDFKEAQTLVEDFL